MDKDHLSKLLLDAQKYMEQYKLVNALRCLKEAAQSYGNGNLETDVYNLKNDYKWMLTFLEQGGVDPQRNKMQQNFVLRTSNLLYRMKQQALMDQPNHYAGNLMRNTRQNPTDKLQKHLDDLTKTAALMQDVLQAAPEMDDSARTLYAKLYNIQNAFFDFLLTADVLHDEDRKAITECLFALPERITYQLLHALFLNSMEAIDLNKVKIIRAFIGHESKELHLLALTLFLILYGTNSQWINLDPALRESVTLLKDIPAIQEDILLIQKQLLLSANTKATAQIMAQEIMPILMRSDLGKNLTNLNEINEEMLDKLMSVDKETVQKINNLREMTQTGYDVNYMMFQSTCRNFFFTKFNNWFCPFDPNHPDLNENSRSKNNQNFLQKISQSATLCDLDKFGMASFLSQLPKEAQNAMLNNAKIEDLQSEWNNTSIPVRDAYCIRNVVQCLYRFYEDCSKSKNLKNVFQQIPMLHTTQKLMDLVNEADFLKDMAQFYVKTKNYEQAQSTLKQLLKIQAADAWCLHTLASTYQNNGENTKALSYGQQAELLDPDNLNLLTMLADLCFKLNKTDLCAGYLKHIEELQALNDEQTDLLIICLLENKEYEEVMNRCYKIKYLKGDIPKTDLILAEAMMQLGRIDEAETIYEKYKDSKQMQPVDFLYWGMAAWINGKQDKAIANLKRFIHPDDWEGLWEELAKDFLKKHHVCDSDIILLQEILSLHEEE